MMLLVSGGRLSICYAWRTVQCSVILDPLIVFRVSASCADYEIHTDLCWTPNHGWDFWKGGWSRIVLVSVGGNRFCQGMGYPVWLIMFRCNWSCSNWCKWPSWIRYGNSDSSARHDTGMLDFAKGVDWFSSIESCVVAHVVWVMQYP